MATMKSFDIAAHIGGEGSTFAPPFSGYVDAKSLAANAAELFTVPAGAAIMILNATEDFWANAVTTATIPGDTSDGSASILNPTQRAVAAGDTVSVISAYACVVTAEYWGGAR